MSYIRNLVLRPRRDAEEGATAVEYGIMVALIAAVIVAIVLVIGQQVRKGFCDTSSAMTTAGATSSSTITTGC